MFELNNQFIFAPVKLGYSKDGKVNEKHLGFYETRSDYLGAVIPEPLYIDKGLREIPTQLGIDDDDKIDGLKKFTDMLHKKGVRAIAHLNHPGRMANPKIPNNYYVSSTDKACENGGAVPQRLNKVGMDKAMILFVDAAVRAEKAGFDFVELQFGHGYLMAQFISPAVNDRDDEYGGEFENRIKFPINVLKAVKDVVKIPIIIRLSGDEMIEKGIKLPEMISFAKILEDNGADALHISAGTVCSTPPWYFQHMFVLKGKTWDMAKKIKESCKLPIIAVGQVNEFKDIDRINDEKMADYIAIGRALVADPDFVGKYLKKVEGNFVPCLSCSDGCLGGVKAGKGLGCVVNPLAGRELPKLEKSKEGKKYAVVGGGLAGMEAALTLNRRGNKVILFEKDKLGGQFNLAWLPPKKGSLKKLVDYYKKSLDESGVKIENKEVSEKDLLESDFDGVILASGAVPVIPPIDGLNDYSWAEILYDENMPKNKKVLVIGGGLIGLEAAHKLMHGGNEVVIVEMLDEIARGMEMIEKAITVKSLNANSVKIFLNTKVVKINGNKVYLRGEKETVLENIDKIVLATGMKSYNPLKEKLDGKIAIYSVGDAEKVGKAQDAISSAYQIAIKL